jgi:NAD(P)-dependent dehydrogenase (short-subunit alcohol dehydrogenase family)
VKILKDKTAAVTGAASGMGRMLAVNLAGEGCHLALADIDASGLQETAKLIGGRVDVTTHVVDVSRREQVFQFADEAAGRHGGVDILINNAGVALGDFLRSVPLEDFEWLMGVNFWGVVYGTMAFLPYLEKRPEGHIVNISSINGIIPTPNNGPYCTSKFAVRGYTKTLMQEMQGTPIRVSLVYPGGVKTSIARNARINRTVFELPAEKVRQMYEDEIFRLTADKAAKIIISGIRHNKKRIRVGADAKAMDWLMRLFPVATLTVCVLLTRRIARVYANQ